jgi:hypothetical protein
MLGKVALAAVTAVNVGAAVVTHVRFETGNPKHGFEIGVRPNNTIEWPVAYLRPTSPGKQIALDLFPTAGAESVGTLGYTWFDACNADLTENALAPVQCARLSIRREGAVFGALSYNGALAHKVLFETGVKLRWGIDEEGTFYPVEDGVTQIGSEVNRVTEVHTVDGPLNARLQFLTARLEELERRLVGAIADAGNSSTSSAPTPAGFANSRPQL